MCGFWKSWSSGIIKKYRRRIDISSFRIVTCRCFPPVDSRVWKCVRNALLCCWCRSCSVYRSDDTRRKIFALIRVSVPRLLYTLFQSFGIVLDGTFSCLFWMNGVLSQFNQNCMYANDRFVEGNWYSSTFVNSTQWYMCRSPVFLFYT